MGLDPYPDPCRRDVCHRLCRCRGGFGWYWCCRPPFSYRCCPTIAIEEDPALRHIRLELKMYSTV